MTPQVRLIAALGLGLVSLVLYAFTFSLEGSDFRNFYEGTQAWLAGGRVYDTHVRPNLNPPWFVAALSPLVPLGLTGAFTAWVTMNLAIGIYCAVLIRKARQVPWAILVLGLTLLPSWLCQVSGIMMLCLTKAWLAKTPIRSGLWLVPLVMLKPPFALLALALPWRIPLVTLLTAGMGTGLLVPIMGVELWQDYLNEGRDVSWLGQPSSGSLLSMFARWIFLQPYGMKMADMPMWTWIVIAGLCPIVLFAVRQARGDQRWARAFLMTMWFAPLGQYYYLPAAVGPLASSLRDWRWCVPVLVILAIPRVLFIGWSLSPGLWAVVTCSMIFVVTICLWFATGRRPIDP